MLVCWMSCTEYSVAPLECGGLALWSPRWSKGSIRPEIERAEGASPISETGFENSLTAERMRSKAVGNKDNTGDKDLPFLRFHHLGFSTMISMMPYLKLIRSTDSGWPGKHFNHWLAQVSTTPHPCKNGHSSSLAKPLKNAICFMFNP